jgi:hypothetical protein
MHLATGLLSLTLAPVSAGAFSLESLGQQRKFSLGHLATVGPLITVHSILVCHLYVAREREAEEERER